MSMNTLRLGSKGEAVSLLQQLLNAGGASVAVDGSFGPATESAVKALQSRNGLLVDGIVGGNTWAKLLDGRTPATSPSPPPPGVKAESIFVGARIVDSYPFSVGGTEKQAKALRAREVDGLAGYLGVITKARVALLLDAGLGFVGVTLANRFDGAAAVAQARALGLPLGTTLALDIEGRKILDGVDWPDLAPAAKETHAKAIYDKCAAWNAFVKAAGFRTMLYVGSPQPLTTKELGDLSFGAYWNALSRESDRFGALAEPKCGWAMWQMIPQHNWKDTGVFVDVNMVGQDFYERVPAWAVRS